MFQILIIDDTNTQIENIIKNLLIIDGCSEATKIQFIKAHFRITVFNAPSEAEAYIQGVKGTAIAPDLILCDVNFNGRELESDNGRFRGLHLTDFILKEMESVPIAIMTLYETNEIQKELRKLTAIGPHRSTRWVYDFNKQGILDDDWAITFNGILRDIIGSNPGKIKIGATSAKQITDALDHNDLERLLEINPEIGYGNRNFSFKSFFIPWLSFKSTESGLKTTFGEDLKEILKENLGILTVELKTSFEVLKKAYLQLKEHDSFKEEIENAVLDAIKIFMDISWENPKEVKAMVIEGNKKTFFKINTFLNMNLLPKINLENPDNLYNINDEKTQGRLINWLKSRLFVITVYELIKNPKYSDVIKRNHFSEEQKNRPFDLAILAGLRNDMTHYNTHLIRDSRKATVKQLFYFLQLQGLLGCKGAEKDYLENSCLMEDEIQFLAQDLNNIFFEIPKTDF